MTGILGSRVAAALGTLANFLMLNLALLVASLPVVTLPAAINAATYALDQWRADGEDRVIREFLAGLRRGPAGSVATGVPLAAVVLGVIEMRHFSRFTGPVDRVALGFGTVALVITLTALGYVFLLAARPAAGSVGGLSGGSVAEFWSACASVALRNIFVTGPLFLAEIAGVTALLVIDPPLALLGLPLGLVQLMRVTAAFGLRRVAG